MEDLKDETNVKAPNLLERVKEEIEAVIHTEKHHHHHHKETHGRSDDIDENTPIDEVKAPNVFERAKEEIEAVVQTIHPKKQPEQKPAEHGGDGGFCGFLGKCLEKTCSPLNGKKD